MLKKILIALATLILALVGYVAFIQPSHFQMSRDTLVAASPEAVFPHVSNLRKAAVWNPFMKADPQIKLEFEGPEAEVGGSNYWKGNAEVGEGRATLTEISPYSLVKVRLDFVQPFAGTSVVTYSLKPEGSQTRLSWAFEGKNNFLARFFCTVLFMNMEKMMGETFEKGLADVKAIVESSAKK